METVLHIFAQDWKNCIYLYRAWKWGEWWRLFIELLHIICDYFLLHYLSLERVNKCKISHQNSPSILTLFIPDFSIKAMHHVIRIFQHNWTQSFLFNWKKMCLFAFLLLLHILCFCDMSMMDSVKYSLCTHGIQRTSKKIVGSLQKIAYQNMLPRNNFYSDTSQMGTIASAYSTDLFPWSKSVCSFIVNSIMDYNDFFPPNNHCVTVCTSLWDISL